MHGLKDLGMQLHGLSLKGEWAEMQRVIPEDVIRVFAQTSTYDKLPDFVRENREYASKLGLGLPSGTPAERERAKHIVAEVGKVQTSGVPRGLEDVTKVPDPLDSK